MTRISNNQPSYFVVPDEKIDYAEFLQLGNVLYRVTEPDNVLSQPRLTEGSHPLGSKTTQSRPLKDYTITTNSDKASKIGFFAKVLELLGLGINASRSNATSASESYTIDSMAISTFKPSDDFLKAVRENNDINDWLHNSQDQCAFLITGVVEATGVKFTSSTSRENEKEGSLGISSQAISVGPSGSRKRKNVLELSYTDEGPTILAYKVQKLHLRKDGTMGAENYVDGAYFGDDEQKYILDDDAELTHFDVEGLTSIVVVDETSDEQLILFA